MKRIPSHLSSLTKSSAEKRLFHVLGDVELSDAAFVLHSLNLPNHLYKRMGEVDFLVVDGTGVLVCEVKGGRVACRDDGVWEFTDRDDNVSKSREGPFAQARSAMFSLKDELESRLEPKLFHSLSLGYCVVFPDQDWTVDSVEEPRELTLTEDDCLDAGTLQAGLRRMLRYWAEKNNRAAIGTAELRPLRNALRPSFDVAPSLRARAAEVVDQLETLTLEQYVGLDWVEAHPRLLVAGGAGTGKTMLAAEIARRDRSRDDSVLLTCQSPILAAHLAGRAGLDGIDILPVDEALATAAESGPWDTVVIDEAQDILTTEGLSSLESLIAGGIEDGRWRCFYDLNNQAGLFGEVDQDAIDYLQAAGGHPVDLHRNCRNPKSVIVYTQTVTGADLGKPLAGEGPQVRARFPSDRDEERAWLVEELARLANESVPAGSITILSGVDRSESVVAGLPPAYAKTIITVDADVASSWPVDRVTFARIDEFKGMENDFVLVVDLCRLRDEQADLARLYVALSRARYGLWIAIPQSLRDEYLAMCEARLETMTAGSNGDR